MKEVLIVIMLATMMGCASTYKTVSYNHSVESARKVVELKAGSSNGSLEASLGVDLLALARGNTGYFAAWKDDPAGMSVATAIDAIVVGGAAYLYKESTDNKTKISEVEQPATYEINAGTVIINRDGTVNFTGVAE
jgi:uncharacterized protein YceK